MNIKNRIVEITLDGKTFKMKFDMETIANIQQELKKKDMDYKFTDIIKGIQEQDFSIMLPVIVHSIKRMHPQIEARNIKELLTLDAFESVVTAMVNLIDASLPTNTEEAKKK